jgi:hypothetical protein
MHECWRGDRQSEFEVIYNSSFQSLAIAFFNGQAGSPALYRYASGTLRER